MEEDVLPFTDDLLEPDCRSGGASRHLADIAIGDAAERVFIDQRLVRDPRKFRIGIHAVQNRSAGVRDVAQRRVGVDALRQGLSGAAS